MLPQTVGATAERSSIPPRAGIGLRFPHHETVIQSRPDVAWFEVHTENYLGGGTPLRCLETIRAHYPISLHGVGLSLGSAQGIERGHLERIRHLIGRVEPGLVSEHLSWSIVDSSYLADLLPLPLTEEALDVVCRNVEMAQNHLGRRLLIENPSSYLRYKHSTIPEWEFLSALTARSGCGILCDVNNIYVSACNHGWDAGLYLRSLPVAAVGEIHLAGHAVRELASGQVLRIDDHGSRVAPAVWKLYADAVALFGAIPTLIEWDNAIPPLSVLLAEAAHADRLLDCSTIADHADAA